MFISARRPSTHPTPREHPGCLGNANENRRGMGSADEFFAARDFLLAHRDDYEAAYRGFKWPVLGEFNWALDYFDAAAEENDKTALHIVDESGSETHLSFAEISAR